MLGIKLEREGEKSLTRQLYEQLRDSILNKKMEGGERVPASRKLAEELAVSRNIVLEVYEQLKAEGYLESRGGSGTYVAEGSYIEQYKSLRRPERPRGRDRLKSEPAKKPLTFYPGHPDLHNFPRKRWAIAMRDSYVDATPDLYSYGHESGLPELREALTKFLLKTKGIECSAEQIIILGGSIQAFNIITRLFAEKSREVIIEDPSFIGIQNIFKLQNYRCQTVDSDDRGVLVEQIPEDCKIPLIVVTPSHHFPLGGILPIQRRVKLIELARRQDLYILENDYDSDFRLQGAPVSSLQLLDPDRVIHIGTFSQILYPSLRLGYMILPENLVEPALNIKIESSMNLPLIQQFALARFIKEGSLERHISRMKKLYKAKRECLLELLEQQFADQIRLCGDAAGLYITAALDGLDLTAPRFSKALQEEALTIDLVENHSIKKGRYREKMLLGFGHLSHDELEDAVGRLKRALQKSFD